MSPRALRLSRTRPRLCSEGLLQPILASRSATVCNFASREPLPRTMTMSCTDRYGATSSMVWVLLLLPLLVWVATFTAAPMSRSSCSDQGPSRRQSRTLAASSKENFAPFSFSTKLPAWVARIRAQESPITTCWLKRNRCTCWSSFSSSAAAMPHREQQVQVSLPQSGRSMPRHYSSCRSNREACRGSHRGLPAARALQVCNTSCSCFDSKSGNRLWRLAAGSKAVEAESFGRPKQNLLLLVRP